MRRGERERSRSRSRRERASPRGRREQGRHAVEQLSSWWRNEDRPASQASREKAQAPRSRGASPPEEKRDAQDAPASKNGRQLAKEAVAKEKEKALLKKQQREKEQQERLAAKEREKALKHQELSDDIGNAGTLALAVASPSRSAVDADRKVASLAQTQHEQAAEAASASAHAPAAAPVVSAREGGAAAQPAATSSTDAARTSEQVDEASVRKLFQLLDRSEKNVISKRDLLVALKKHAPVRVLFGLPAGSAGAEGDDLQQRINAIQDAFEASSGLGELGEIFDELSRGGGGTGQSFAWESFLARCQQETGRRRAAEALLLMPREHTVGACFEATYEWKVVPEGAACEAGLEYKMDMATGKTLGRLPRPKTMK